MIIARRLLSRPPPDSEVLPVKQIGSTRCVLPPTRVAKSWRPCDGSQEPEISVEVYGAGGPGRPRCGPRRGGGRGDGGIEGGRAMAPGALPWCWWNARPHCSREHFLSAPGSKAAAPGSISNGIPGAMGRNGWEWVGMGRNGYHCRNTCHCPGRVRGEGVAAGRRPGAGPGGADSRRTPSATALPRRRQVYSKLTQRTERRGRVY